MDETSYKEQNDAPGTEKKSSEFDWTPPANPVLARLIEEVRTEKTEGPTVYNRFHNRHNRSKPGR